MAESTVVWFGMRKKYCSLDDKSWLISQIRPNEQAVDRLYHGTEAHCINELRMRKAVFHRLCDELRSRALLEETFHVTIEEQIAMFIHCVGQRWSNRSIGFEFIRSSETVSRYFHHVLDALCTLARDLICIRSVDTHSKITSAPGRFHHYFEVHKNC